MTARECDGLARVTRRAVAQKPRKRLNAAVGEGYPGLKDGAERRQRAARAALAWGWGASPYRPPAIVTPGVRSAPRAGLLRSRDAHLGAHAGADPASHGTRQPDQNAYIESFNGRFRDECLHGHWFTYDPGPAQALIEACGAVNTTRSDRRRVWAGGRPLSTRSNWPRKAVQSPPDSKADRYSRRGDVGWVDVRRAITNCLPASSIQPFDGAHSTRDTTMFLFRLSVRRILKRIE